ncbi:MAG: (d)CMP kinase [Prevotella sp.]
MKKIIVAIDGYSSCGKSTMAKDLAKEIGYIYVDTGAMYRAVTLFALRNNLIINNDIATDKLEEALPQIEISFKLNNETGRPDTYLNNRNVEKEIRSIEVSSHVSLVAAQPFVRRHLVAQQQLMGLNKGVVMDGRDIGTTVFPDAEMKIFVTADPRIRAERRYEELKAKGMTADFFEILKNVQQRDYADTHRETSPLRQADDAIVLDNSSMSIGEQKQWLMNIFEEKTKD